MMVRKEFEEKLVSLSKTSEIKQTKIIQKTLMVVQNLLVYMNLPVLYSEKFHKEVRGDGLNAARS